MSLDDHLRHALDELTARVRDEVAAQASATLEAFRITAEGERAEAVARAAADARAVAEREAEQRLAAAMAEAEQRMAALREDAAQELASRLSSVRNDLQRDADAKLDVVREETELAAAKRIAAAKEAAERDATARIAAVREDVEQHMLARVAAAREDAEQQATARIAAVREETEQGIAARLAAARVDAEREAAVRIAAARSEAERDVASRISAARADVERDVTSRLTAARAEAEAEVRAECQHEEAAARDRMLGAIRSMDRADALSDILDILVSSANAEVSRTGIFLIEGDRLRSWRCAGFGARLSDSGALALPLGDAGILADAARTGFVANAGPSSPAAAPAFAELPQGRRAVAVPLQMSGEVFAVLYADQGQVGEARNGAWPATLEVLARHAARSLEAVTAFRLAQVEASV